MKIKFNQLSYCLFYQYNMNLNIDKEYNNLIKVINDDTFDYKLCKSKISPDNLRINFLWQVLVLTIKYPQVELYLKDLLKYFTVSEIEKLFYGWTIVHYMSYNTSRISLNAFKMVINYGVNINIKTDNDGTLAHTLLCNPCNDHNCSILNLFIKHGINLNAIDNYGQTILDVIIYHQKNLNEETKNCIMTLVDFGVTTNIFLIKNEIYDYVEYCKNSTIKPAIRK